MVAGAAAVAVGHGYSLVYIAGREAFDKIIGAQGLSPLFFCVFESLGIGFVPELGGSKRQKKAVLFLPINSSGCGSLSLHSCEL
ncbi:hypothetical protein Taro_013472 [Colocasia esculenta]|uniref:Uncharacterized protein n=1 Tax=Colocasia esculenta TaxID=4460 RepID=A0A843UGK7_COLES|nr:hypothetical protein [Colocasia esculenta]